MTDTTVALGATLKDALLSGAGLELAALAVLLAALCYGGGRLVLTALRWLEDRQLLETAVNVADELHEQFVAPMKAARADGKLTTAEMEQITTTWRLKLLEAAKEKGGGAARALLRANMPRLQRLAVGLLKRRLA